MLTLVALAAEEAGASHNGDADNHEVVPEPEDVVEGGVLNEILLIARTYMDF